MSQQIHSKNPFTKKYDVILFCNLYPPLGGGLERAAEGLAKYLANEKLQKVLVISSAGEDEYFQRDKVDCLTFNSLKIFHGFYPIVGLKLFWSTVKLLRRSRNTNIVIYGRHFTESMVVSFVCKFLRRKYLYVDTGFEPNVFKNKLVNKIINFFDLTIFRLVIQFAEVRIFVSETSKKFVISRYGKWLQDAEVILNGFDECIVKKFPFKAKQKNIIYASRLVNVKNPDTVVDAYLSLSSRYPDWNFYLIGKGRCKLDKIGQNKLPDNVIYQKNLLPQHEFHKLLSQSAIYVNSSTSEGLPLSIIEAGGLGCMLVLSDISHNMEVAKVAGLEKYSFPAKEIHTLVERLEQAILDSKLDKHKKIQNKILEAFANRNVFVKYWQLLK